MTALEPGKTILNVEEIMQVLPHRFPMLMLDRLIEIRAGESAIGVKNVSYNEQYFQGHFPAKSVMPGVLIIEAMAQAAAAFTAYTEQVSRNGKIVLFTGVDRARFRRPVTPGDQLLLHVRIVQARPPLWRFEGEGTVEGKRVAEAKFAAMLVDASEVDE